MDLCSLSWQPHLRWLIPAMSRGLELKIRLINNIMYSLILLLSILIRRALMAAIESKSLLLRTLPSRRQEIRDGVAELLKNGRRQWVEDANGVDLAFHPWITSMRKG